MNRVPGSTLVLAFTLIVWSTPVRAVTITFTDASFINFTEPVTNVGVTVTTETTPPQNIPQCQPPETVAGAAPCVRRILSNPEFGFVELSVPPGTFPAAPESTPAQALLLEADGRTISDRVTVIVDPASPTGFPRDTVTVRFDSDTESGLGPTPGGLQRQFVVPETGAVLDLTSNFFTGTGANLTDRYTIPQGFFVKAQSDVDVVAEPATIALITSGVAGLGVVIGIRRRNAHIASASCSAAGRGSSGRARRSATSKRFLSSATRLFTGSVVARSGYGRR